MRYNKLSNAELLKRFETACFHITNYPTNKSYSNEFTKLEREIASRLDVKVDEIDN